MVTANAPNGRDQIRAIILLSLDSTGGNATPGAVLNEAKENPAVDDAWVVLGEVDLVLSVGVDSIESLERLVLEELRALPGVSSSRTYIILPHHEISSGD